MMKLLYCTECDNIVKLKFDYPKECACGSVGGQYLDKVNIEYWGNPILIGFANESFKRAVEKVPWPTWGVEFIAFIFSPEASSVRKVEKP